MYKIGLSSCGFDLTEENFIKLKESGVSAIEISMNSEKYAHINYDELKALSEKYQIELWSFHLPFWPFDTLNIAALDESVRQNSINYLKTFIDKATAIGIDKFIIHPSGEPNGDNEREDKMKYAMESLDILAEYAHARGAVIAVEDLPRTCLGNTADDILKLISANDKLKVCFDTNHLLKDNNLNFINKVGDKILTVHVSDYDFINERHWLPGEGKVDWKELYNALKECYNGIWMYEISLNAENTMRRNRPLCFDDFVKNANNIFNGKNPLDGMDDVTREYLV